MQAQLGEDSVNHALHDLLGFISRLATALSAFASASGVPVPTGQMVQHNMLVTNEMLEEVACQQRGSYRPVASFGTLLVLAQSANDVWVKPYVTQVTVIGNGRLLYTCLWVRLLERRDPGVWLAGCSLLSCDCADGTARRIGQNWIAALVQVAAVVHSQSWASVVPAEVVAS